MKRLFFLIVIAWTALHLRADPISIPTEAQLHLETSTTSSTRLNDPISIPTEAQLHRCVQEAPQGVIAANQNDADRVVEWIRRSELDQLVGEELRELLRPGRITEVRSAIFNLRCAFDPIQIFDDGSYRRREQIRFMRRCSRWVEALADRFNERVARLKPLLDDYRREPGGGNNAPYYRDATLSQDSDVYSDETGWQRIYTLRAGAKVRMIVPYLKVRGDDKYQKVIYTTGDGKRALGWVLRRNLLPEQ